MNDLAAIPLEPLNESALRAYFKKVRGFAPGADSPHSVNEHQFDIGGKVVALCSAEDSVLQDMTRALAHLRRNGRSQADFTIYLWQGDSDSGLRPPSPLKWYHQARPEVDWSTIVENHYDIRGEIAAFNSRGIRTAFHSKPNILRMLDVDNNEAIYWIEKGSQLPYYEKSAPFHKILSWWLSENGRFLAHSGAVGNESGAVLLIGRSGSGKSTTALACMNGGLFYMGDDYCILDNAQVPQVYSLYNTAKLKNRDDLQRFPHLEKSVVNLQEVGQEKAQIFLNEDFSRQLARQLPLKGIVLPRLSVNGETRLVPASTAEIIGYMAPSTIQQLPGSGRAAFGKMIDLAKKVPGFILELGPDLASIPRTIENYLEQSA